MTQNQHRRRAMLVADRKRRAVERQQNKLRAQYAFVSSTLRRVRRERDEIAKRLCDALPFYVRVQENAHHMCHYGRIFACSVSFNMDSLLLCLQRKLGPEPQDISRQAYCVSQDMAEKIRITIVKELSEKLGMSYV